MSQDQSLARAENAPGKRELSAPAYGSSPTASPPSGVTQPAGPQTAGILKRQYRRVGIAWNDPEAVRAYRREYQRARRAQNLDAARAAERAAYRAAMTDEQRRARKHANSKAWIERNRERYLELSRASYRRRAFAIKLRNAGVTP